MDLEPDLRARSRRSDLLTQLPPIPGDTLFEWVPNVSEGRDAEVIARLARCVEGPAVRLVHQTSDADHHRTVFTVIGRGAALIEALLRLLRSAREHLDLTSHRGVHPRLGVVDVSPFVPLGDGSMTDAVALARHAARAAGELLPVYLYGEAARAPERAPLAAHRRHGLEHLIERAAAGSWTADEPAAGGVQIDPRIGVLLIGARRPLIAFNVELASADVRYARTIAARIRASAEGGLPGVLALGLALPSRGTTQVSMNIVDPTASLEPVVRRIEREAATLSVRVLGSELIGLMPRAAARGATAEDLGLPQLDEDQFLEHHTEAADDL